MPTTRVAHLHRKRLGAYLAGRNGLLDALDTIMHISLKRLFHTATTDKSSIV